MVSTDFRQCRSTPPLYGLLVVVFTALAGYYLWQWQSPKGFVHAIDHGYRLFCDFFRYYYPMGKDVLRSKQPVSGYFYSAFFALILFPFGLLSERVVFWAWGSVQFLCILIAWALPIRRFLKNSPKLSVCYAGLITISLPVFHNFAWGQISMLMIVSVFAAFDAYMAKRRILAGCLLAFAAVIKYYPALFLVYFLLKRDVRVLIAFSVAGFFFFAILPAAVLGTSNWIAFQNATMSVVDKADWTSSDVNSQYLVHVGLRYALLLCPSWVNPTCTLVLKLLSLAVAALSVAVVWRLQRREVCGEVALSMTALLLSQPFLLKTSWPHYFCYLPFCQTVLLARLGSPFRGNLLCRILFTLVSLSVFMSSTFLFNCFRHWSIYSEYGLLFFSNALLLVPLYVVAFGKGLTEGLKETSLITPGHMVRS